MAAVGSEVGIAVGGGDGFGVAGVGVGAEVGIAVGVGVGFGVAGVGVGAGVAAALQVAQQRSIKVPVPNGVAFTSSLLQSHCDIPIM